MGMKGNRPKPLKQDNPFTPRILRHLKPKIFLPDTHSPVLLKDSGGANKSVPSLPRLEKSRGSDLAIPQSLSSRSLAVDHNKTLGSERPISSRRSGVLSPRFMANVLQRTNDAIKCSDSSIEVQDDEVSLQKLLAGKSMLDFSRTYHLADLESGQLFSNTHIEEFKESPSRGVISFANVSRKRGVKRIKGKDALVTHKLHKAQSQIKELQASSDEMRRRMEFHRERIKVLEEYCLNLNARFKGEVEKIKKSLALGGEVAVRQQKEASTSTEPVEDRSHPVHRPPPQASQCCMIM